MAKPLVLLPLLAGLAACGLPQNVVVLLPDDAGTVGQVIVSNAAGSQKLDQGSQAVGVAANTAPGTPFIASRSDVDRAFAGALGATPRAAVSRSIYFLTGEAEPDPASSPEIAAAIATAKSLTNIDVSVVGHADATGTDEENRALSLRRAERIRDLLVAGGVPADRIEVSYFGANVPAVPTPPGVAEPRNRRVVVTIR